MKSKKLIAFLSAITMLGSAFCTLPAMAAAGDDIVQHGDMEGHPDNSLLPYNWGHHSTWRSDEEGGPYIDSVAEGRKIGGNNVLVLSEVTDENAAGFGFNRGAVQYINDVNSIHNIKPGKSYKVSLTIGNLNETGESEYQVIFEGAGNPTYENNKVTIAAGETGYINDALISVPEGADVQYSTVVIQPVDSKGTFWIDNVSIIEQPDTILEISTDTDLSNAFINGGFYNILNDITATTATSLGKTEGNALTTGNIDGKSYTITYDNIWTAMLSLENEAGTNNSWNINNTIFAGKGRFFNVNGVKLTLKNVTFANSSENKAIANQGGTVTLDNVVFPSRTDGGYDVVSQWACGDLYLKGATKATILREAQHYALHTKDLAKGADVFIKVNISKTEGDETVLDEETTKTEYERIKSQAISDDLLMTCDDKNYTIHITTKPEFAGVVTNVVAVNGTGNYSATAATAFETTVSNKGGEGTVKSITWDITANGTTKSATANPTDLTLEKGAAVNLVLIVNGLHTTEKSTVVTVK